MIILDALFCISWLLIFMSGFYQIGKETLCQQALNQKIVKYYTRSTLTESNDQKFKNCNHTYEIESGDESFSINSKKGLVFHGKKIRFK